MTMLSRTTGLAALLLSAAILGFFYAWVCSTMWGLDALPPETAIRAMQAMNASVRNAVFAPAFFGTGPALLLAAAVALRASPQASLLFCTGGVLYLVGAMGVTLTVNVPMNMALGQVEPTPANAAAIWAAYSPRWQFWNIVRTVVSGGTVILAGMALLRLPRNMTQVGAKGTVPAVRCMPGDLREG